MNQASTMESSLGLKPWMPILEESPACLDSRYSLTHSLHVPLDSSVDTGSSSGGDQVYKVDLTTESASD